MSQFYPFTDPVAAQAHPPMRVISGKGIKVTDTQGHIYLDAVAGLWCASLGFAPERLTAAMTRQMNELAFYHSFMGRTCDVTERFAQELVTVLPEGLTHVMFANSGSEAVETATKCVRFYQNARGKPEKKIIISREGSYHGSAQVGAALTSMAYCHDGFDVPMERVLRTGRPHFYKDAEAGETEIAFSRRRAAELDALIREYGADRIGAFIGEPAMGSGGAILPPEGYWAEIQNVLAKHDVLLIADEIITGFGRTGEWFGCDTYSIRPDMMTMAKQMTASVFPMSAVAMTQEVRDTISTLAHDLGTFGHGMTYGGHPVGAAVGLETLAIYREMDLPRHVQKMSQHLTRRLDELRDLPSVGDIRVQGLLAGIEFKDSPPHGPGLAGRVLDEAKRRGVLFRMIGEVLAISPPYITTPEELNQIMDVMRDSILTVTQPVVAE
jgi:adenosylmethionine-8-amino-7-oxononanoate aminotransferase